MGSLKLGSKKSDGKDEKKVVSTAPVTDLGNMLYNEKLSELGAARLNLEKKAQAAALLQKKERAKKKI